MKRRGLRVAELFLFLLAVIYFIFVFYFQSHFAFKTKVNQIDVGGMSAAQLGLQLQQKAENYRLTLVTWDGKQEAIEGTAIGIKITLPGQIKDVLKKQNAFAWPYYLLRGQQLQIRNVVSYDRQACEEKIKQLDFMKKDTWVPSRDAYISGYTKDGYAIVPEVYGSEIRSQELKKAVEEAVLSMEDVLDLAAAGCYIEPEVTTGDETLNELTDTLNRYVGTVIRYEVGEKEERLDEATIHEWLSIENQKVKIDEQQVAAYVSGLAKKYNTAYHSRKLETSYGRSVAVIGGDYGWKVDTAAEKDMILKDIRAGDVVKREIVYAQRANSHEENDYGDTYVEINLTAQHLFYYKKGKLITEADLVSGSSRLGYGTITGAYSIIYKQKDAVLDRGEEERKVAYWMPFANGIGLCDAAWRTRFGGDIYKEDGSYGCIELPEDSAKELYEKIDAGCPVLIYELTQGIDE